MRSGTSFFNGTVFKKTIFRFWPLWGAYFAVWLVALPLNGLMTLRLDQANHSGWGGSYMESFAYVTVPRMASRFNFALVLAVLFGVLCAMAVLSHLYSARSANLFGSLPVRREGLFLTHYLAGLCFLLVPNGVIFLLTALVELAGGTVCWPGLGFWLAATCGEGFFFYSLAVFCGLFTGHILALPVFYAVANVLVAGVAELVNVVFRSFYYGFAGFPEGVYTGMQWCTPAWKLLQAVESYSYQFENEPRTLTLNGLSVVGVYAIAAAVLAVGAFFLYRGRRLESAGDVVSVGPMRPVFKYGVAFCSGLALGILTSVFTGGGEAMLMPAILIWGVIGYFAGEMLLQKSFRVFSKWKGAVAVAGVFGALFLVAGLDLTGFETRVPDLAQVEDVYVRGIDAVYLHDNGDYIWQKITAPEHIALMNLLHRAAVEQRGEELHFDSEGVDISLELTYTLKDGGRLRRRYDYLWLDPEEVDTEGTAAWAVQQLYNDRELYWQVYGFDRLEQAMAEGVRLERAELEHYDEEAGETKSGAVFGADARALLAAVKEDFFAGRIGVRRVDDEEHWHFIDNLTFTSGEAEGGGHFQVRIALQDTASSTLAALDEMELE